MFDIVNAGIVISFILHNLRDNKNIGEGMIYG